MPKSANQGITNIGLAALTDGTEVAAWIEWDAYGNRLLVARLDASGVWSVPRVLDTDVALPRLVRGPTDTLLAWTGRRSAYLYPVLLPLRAARLVAGEFEDPTTLDVFKAPAASLAVAAGPGGLAVAVGLYGPGPAAVVCTHDGSSWSSPHRFANLGNWTMGGIVLPESATMHLVSSPSGYCAVAGVVGDPSRAMATVFAAGVWSQTTDLFDGSQIGRVKGIASDNQRYAVLADSNGPGRVRVHAGGVWGAEVDVGERFDVLGGANGTFAVAWRRGADGALAVATNSGGGWGAAAVVAGSVGSAAEDPVLALDANAALLAWRPAVDTLSATLLQGGSFTAPVVLTSGSGVLTGVRATSNATGFAASWAVGPAQAGTIVRAAYTAGAWQAPLAVPIPDADPVTAAIVERTDGFSALVVQQSAERAVWWSGHRGAAFVPAQRLSSATPARAPIGQNASPRIAVSRSGSVFVAWAAIDSSRVVRQVLARQTNDAAWLPEVALTESLSTGVLSLDVARANDAFLVAHDTEARNVVLRSGASNWGANVLATTGGVSGFYGVRAAAAGDKVAVAWIENGEYARGRLWAVVSGEVPVALDTLVDAFRIAATGDRCLLVSNQGSTLRVHRRASGSSWNPPEDLDADGKPLIGFSLAAAGDAFVAAWSRPGVVTARHEAQGGASSWLWQLSGGLIGDPVVAPDRDGPVVGWIEDGAPFAVAPAVAGAEPFLLDPSPGITRAFAAMRAGDGVDVVWAREDSGTTTITGRRFEAGVWSPPVTIAFTPWRVFDLVLAPTPEGYTAAWEESGDIRAAVRVPRR